MGRHIGVLLHQERCFEQVYNIPSRIVFMVFFFFNYLSFVFIASVLLVSGNLVYHSSPGNTLERTFTQLTIVSGLFFHLPQHHMAGSGAGIWMHLQRAGIRYRRLVFFWPFSFRHLWFSRKRRTRSNARRSAKSETEISLRILQ